MAASPGSFSFEQISINGKSSWRDEYLAGERSVDGVWQVPKQAGSFASARQMTLLHAEVLAFGEFGGTNIFFFTIKSLLSQALEDSCLYL